MYIKHIIVLIYLLIACLSLFSACRRRYRAAADIYAHRKAITPIPVMYYKGKELVFAVNFSITYKNNVEVGKATVIMHGKSRFNGQHVRKFNIARTD